MRKKIAIIHSAGGGGHLMVSDALQECLGDSYDIVTASMLGEILSPIDPARLLTAGWYDAESFYNVMVSRSSYGFINGCATVATCYFSARSAAIEGLIRYYLIRYGVDLVISVVPLFNGPLLRVTAALRIPFILVPTDLDVRTFLTGIDAKTARAHPHFRVAYSFEDSLLYEGLTRTCQREQLVGTGFALRAMFFEPPADRATVRRSLHVHEEKKVVMVMMGLQGSLSLPVIVRYLTLTTRPLHLLLCVGKRPGLADAIGRIPFPPHITYTIIGYTKDIATIMHASDLIITKSGTVSVCEAMYMGKPVVLDATARVLNWERFNHDFVERYGMGTAVKCLSDLPAIVERWLEHDPCRPKALPFAMNNGAHGVRVLIQKVLGTTDIARTLQ